MKPIIFIPGIEATALVDANSFNFEVKWNAFDTAVNALQSQILGLHFSEKLQLNPLFDENINSVIERNHIARLPYEKTIYNISQKYPNSPVYLFGYDWRLSNQQNAKRLLKYIEYLKEKLSDKKPLKFQFVTHSMGALLFSCYLKELNGNYSDIDKVVMCAPPFKGSPYALVHMVKGDGGAKSFLNKIFGQNDDVRKVVRTFPSIFELLPWYDDSIVFEGGGNVDLSKIINWQSNVYDDNPVLFQARLNELINFRSTYLTDFSKLPVDLRSRMIIIAGDSDKTISKIKVIKQKGSIKNFVRLDNMEISRGDGTVPIQSSTFYKDFVRTIIVKKENLFSELGDNLDFHGLFLRDSRVQNIIIRTLDDRIQSTIIRDPNVNKQMGAADRDWWDSIGESVKALKMINEN